MLFIVYHAGYCYFSSDFYRTPPKTVFLIGSPPHPSFQTLCLGATYSCSEAMEIWVYMKGGLEMKKNVVGEKHKAKTKF